MKDSGINEISQYKDNINMDLFLDKYNSHFISKNYIIKYVLCFIIMYYLFLLYIIFYYFLYYILGLFSIFLTPTFLMHHFYYKFYTSL